MSTKKDFEQAAPGTVTRAERDQRIAARPRPRAELHLTPSGWEATQVRHELDQQSERRIRHINERLEEARARLKNGYSRARWRGRAAQDFDRER